MFVFFSILLIYVVTLCPTIYVGDSPLFAAASYSLGTAHPPGYPLFILAGKLATFLPFGNIAFKVNLANAVFGSLSGFMVYKIVRYLTGNRYAAWASALFLAVVPVFWAGSINAKGVYSLNTFLCLLIFFLTLKIMRKEGNFYCQSFLIAFVIGLGMGNHHTIPLMGLAALPVFLMRWRDVKFRWLLFMVVFFLAGFSVNLLIYVRSRVAVTSGILLIYSYGGSLKDFLNVLLRKAYHSGNTISALEGGTSNVFLHFPLVVRNVFRYILIPNLEYGIPFILIGLFGFLKDKRLFIYIIFLLFFWIAFFGGVTVGVSPTEEDIEVISVYYVPLFSFMAVILGMGMAWVLEKARLLKMQSNLVPRFLSCAAVAFPLCLMPQAVLPNHALAYTFARDMLTTLPVRSMILHYNDNPTFTTFYMQSVERYREDILAMSAGGDKDYYGIETAQAWKYRVLYPEFYASQKTKISYLDKEFALRGKLFTSNPNDLTELVKKHYSFSIVPLEAVLYPKGVVPKAAELDKKFLAANDFLDYDSVKSLPYINDFLATELVNHYAIGLMVYGDILERQGQKELGRKAMAEAFRLGDIKSFLGPYIKSLYRDGRTEEALVFLRNLEKSPSGRDSAVAHIVEYKLLSLAGRRQEADAKYRFIKENQILKMINATF
jgi:4-amino-4-deoxy-L-arabinose transferase-like glycosyltransferase